MIYPTELTVFTRFMSQNIYTQITTRAKTAATCVLKPSVKSPNKGGRTPPPTRPTISKADVFHGKGENNGEQVGITQSENYNAYIEQGHVFADNQQYQPH